MSTSAYLKPPGESSMCFGMPLFLREDGNFQILEYRWEYFNPCFAIVLYGIVFDEFGSAAEAKYFLPALVCINGKPTLVGLEKDFYPYLG